MSAKHTTTTNHLLQEQKQNKYLFKRSQLTSFESTKQTLKKFTSPPSGPTSEIQHQNLKNSNLSRKSSKQHQIKLNMGNIKKNFRTTTALRKQRNDRSGEYRNVRTSRQHLKHQAWHQTNQDQKKNHGGPPLSRSETHRSKSHFTSSEKTKLQPDWLSQHQNKHIDIKKSHQKIERTFKLDRVQQQKNSHQKITSEKGLSGHLKRRERIFCNKNSHQEIKLRQNHKPLSGIQQAIRKQTSISEKKFQITSRHHQERRLIFKKNITRKDQGSKKQQNHDRMQQSSEITPTWKQASETFGRNFTSDLRTSTCRTSFGNMLKEFCDRHERFSTSWS